MDLNPILLKHPMVTGAGGFIGYHLTLKLASTNLVERVIAVDLPGSLRLEQLSNHPKVECVEFDLCSRGLSNRVDKKPSVIFALAARNGTSLFYSHPLTVLSSAALPTLNVIFEFGNHCPIIYSSSSEVYAGTLKINQEVIPTKEDVPICIEDIKNPRWSYATGKLFGEIAMLAASEEIGLRGAIVRYHNVYGPNMGNDHFVPDFVNRSELGIYELYGANQTRSFMYVDDAVDGTLAATRANLDDIPIYHLGNPEEMSILSAAEIILDEMGIVGDAEIKILPAPLGSTSRRLPDVTKSRVELGWHAKIPFREGVSRYIASRTTPNQSV